MQFHDLTLAQMTEKNAYALGSVVGIVKQVERMDDNLGSRRSFLRVRIEMSSEDPLVRGVWTKEEGELVWIECKYERLGDLCYNCGRLSHTNKTCYIEKQVNEEAEYGCWPRATPIKSFGTLN